MAFYYGAQQHHPSSSTSSHAGSHNNHHGGRSRRAPRVSSQNSHRQFRGVRSMKDLTEIPVYNAFLQRFEACKGFELDDDMEFCPGLLTEDDLQSVTSSSSDRSSLSSGSPTGSPLQQQVQPAQVSPPFHLSQPFPTASYHTANQPPRNQPLEKIHQPSALRTRSAIPIVDPNTMQRVASPPQSISPARMQQQTYLRNRFW